MCHEYTSRAWDREPESVETDEERDETPEFANDEGGDEVELLTDGGGE
jgi:hypothetical protein